MAEERSNLQATSNDPGEPWLKALKVFVVVTAVVLVLGTAAFLYLLMDKRESERAEREARRTGPAAAIDVPEGARVGDVVVEGGRALLVLEGPDGRSYLLYLDLETGERLSFMALQ